MAEPAMLMPVVYTPTVGESRAYCGIYCCAYYTYCCTYCWTYYTDCAYYTDSCTYWRARAFNAF